MRKKKQKLQLRKCNFCHKPGHNKATCPAFSNFLKREKNKQERTASLAGATAPKTPATGGTIKLFVHHVTEQPAHSPYVVNLKKEAQNSWNKVATVSPKPGNSMYHFHHLYSANQNIENPAEQKPFFAPLNQNKPLPAPRAQGIWPDGQISGHPVARPRGILSALTPHMRACEGLARKNKQVCFSLASLDNKFELPELETKKRKITPHISAPAPTKNSPARRLALKRFNPYYGLLKISDDIGAAIKYNFSTLKKTDALAKIAAGVGVIALIIILPGPTSSYFADIKFTKNLIAQDSTAAFASLQDSTAALMQANIPQAQSAITDALQKFSSAVYTMQTKHQFLQKITTVLPILNDEVESRQQLILAGQKIALGNTYLLKGLGEAQQNVDLKITDRVQIIANHLQAAIPNYEDALQKLSAVKTETLPLEYQQPFNDFKVLFTAILNDFKQLSNLSGAIQEVFGKEGMRRYLLVFQNQNELRPTGGFLGSFAIVDIKDGELIKIDTPAGGSYDLQGQLDTYLEPPTPLLLSDKRWEFQDANWFPDFPSSAQKLLWFYRHSRNITADGVIAINATVLNRLLAIIGPVSDEKRDIVLTSNNAVETLQNIVENGPEKQDNKPKQIIADLAPKFVNGLEHSQPKNILPLLLNLQEALTQKEIQSYFTNEKTQNTIANFGWGGEILNTASTQDYLMVVNANIQGGKSDANIKQSISHQAVIAPDGTITDTVLITRTHAGNAQEKLYGQTNVDYLRLYVPIGSKLISASGFSWPDEGLFKVPEAFYKKDEFLLNIEKEIAMDDLSGTRITEEFNKNAFGNWIITEPGQTSQAQFTYQLPFKANAQTAASDSYWGKILGGNEVAAHYQLVAQKQSGCESEFDSQIIFPSTWETKWHEGDNIERAANGITIKTLPLQTDKIWSLVMKMK